MSVTTKADKTAAKKAEQSRKRLLKCLEKVKCAEEKKEQKERERQEKLEKEKEKEKKAHKSQYTFNESEMPATGRSKWRYIGPAPRPPKTEEEEEKEREAKKEARKPKIPEIKEITLLDFLGIKTSRDFRWWALRNHPDKGGDLETFQDVSNLVDKFGL